MLEYLKPTSILKCKNYLWPKVGRTGHYGSYDCKCSIDLIYDSFIYIAGVIKK